MEIVREAVTTNAYDLLALDSLDALYSLVGLENPRRELFHLFGTLKDLGLTSFLISEIPFGSRKITQFGEDFLADGIVHLRHVEVNESDVQLRLRCVKMRMMRNLPSYLTLVHDGNGFFVTNVMTRSRDNEPRPVLAK